MQSTLTSKGQTTLPKEVREALGLKPGDAVKFLIQADGTVTLLPKISAAALRGILKGRVTKPVTIEEMRAAVVARAGELDAMSRIRRR